MLTSKHSAFTQAVLIIFLSALSGRMAAEAGLFSNSGAESKNGSDIEIMGSTPLASKPDERFTVASALSEGGFLAASSPRGGGAFLSKLSGDGKVLWRTPLPPAYRARSGGVTSDGRYWLGGSLGASDAVQIVAIDGGLTDLYPLARIASDNRFLICAAELDRKYLQITSVELDDYLRIPVSSISMTGGDGDRLWEKLRPFEQERRIAPTPQQFLSCAGIFTTSDHHVLAAQQILVWPVTHSAAEIQAAWGSGSRERPGTLVLAYDLAGNEIAHLRDDDTDGGLLIPAPHGAILFESSRNPGRGIWVPEDRQVHIRWLDSNLKDIAAPLIMRDGPYDIINAAHVTPEGDLLMAGCAGSAPGGIFVRYISHSHAISPKKQLKQLGNCDGSYWIASGAHPHEMLLLSQTSDESLLTTLRTHD